MKLPEWANWLAREEYGDLWAFENKPLKRIGLGAWVEIECGGERVEETDDTFSHIKWTDEEPTKVKRGLEAAGISVAELNRIMNAKAHGYDSVPELAETPDIINEPSHYKGRHGLEAIEVVRNFGNDDMIAGFYWGNAIKYMTRYRNKNGLEDLKKARKNLDWLIEHTEAIE